MEDVGAGARLKTWLAGSGLSLSYLSVSCLDFTSFLISHDYWFHIILDFTSVLISHDYWFHIILQKLRTQRAEQSSSFRVKHNCSSLMIICTVFFFKKERTVAFLQSITLLGLSQYQRQNSLRRKILTETSYSSVHDFQDIFSKLYKLSA